MIEESLPQLPPTQAVDEQASWSIEYAGLDSQQLLATLRLVVQFQFNIKSQDGMSSSTSLAPSTLLRKPVQIAQSVSSITA